MDIMDVKSNDLVILVSYALCIIVPTVIFKTVNSFLITVIITTSVLLVYLTCKKYKYTRSTNIKDYSSILWLLATVLCLVYIAVT